MRSFCLAVVVLILVQTEARAAPRLRSKDAQQQPAENPLSLEWIEEDIEEIDEDEEDSPQQLTPPMRYDEASNSTHLTDESVNGSNPLAALQYANLHRNIRERSKELRLKEIKNYVLNSLGYTRKQPVVNDSLPTDQVEHMRTMLDRFNHRDVLKWGASAGYTGKVQSFYPSCETPRNTDEEAWMDSELFHIYVDLSYLKLKNEAMNVISAKLRIFKYAQPAGAMETLDVSESGSTNEEDVSASTTSSPSSSLGLDIEGSALQTAALLKKAAAHDEKIRVSVYWYTRSLKKHRAKKKLLDTKMLSVHNSEWISFDIQRAVRSWLEQNKNFGLLIEVENEDGVVLSANNYVAFMNCSNDAVTTRPLPGFLMEAALMEDVNSSAPLEPPHYPMVDICTIEIPQEEEDESNLLFAQPLAQLAGLGQLAMNQDNQGSLLTLVPADEPAKEDDSGKSHHVGVKPSRLRHLRIRHRHGSRFHPGNSRQQQQYHNFLRHATPFPFPILRPIESETLATIEDVDYMDDILGATDVEDEPPQHSQLEPSASHHQPQQHSSAEDSGDEEHIRTDGVVHHKLHVTRGRFHEQLES